MGYTRTIILLLLCNRVLAQPVAQAELGWPSTNSSGGGGIACVPPSAIDMDVQVLTNSSTTFTLAGLGGSFGIVVNPTNGTLTGLNSISGSITYNETNSSASFDYFVYSVTSIGTGANCTTNGSVYITILTTTNGQCLIPPPTAGIYTNVVVLPTLGQTIACLTWTNSSCVRTQYCQTVVSGETVFYVDLNSTCSQSLCSSNCTFSTNCFLTAAHVANAGIAEYDGDYFLNATNGDNSVTLTNANGSGLGVTQIPYTGVPRYAGTSTVWYEIQPVTGGADASYQTTDGSTVFNFYSPCFTDVIPPSQFAILGDVFEGSPAPTLNITNSVVIITNCP